MPRKKNSEPDFTPRDFGVIESDDFVQFEESVSILRDINNMGEVYYDLLDNASNEQNRLQNLDPNILGSDVVEYINSLFDQFGEEYQELLNRLQSEDLEDGLSDLNALAIIEQMRKDGDINGDQLFYSTDDLEQAQDVLQQAGRVNIPKKTRRINPDGFLRRPIFNREATQNRHQAEAVLARLDEMRDKNSQRREQMSQANTFVLAQTKDSQVGYLYNIFDVASKLLSLAGQAQDTLQKAHTQGSPESGSLSRSEELITPLQASAAERCLLELKKYTGTEKETKGITLSPELRQAGIALEQALNINELIKKTSERIADMLVELRNIMANKNTEINGINTLLDSLMDDSQDLEEQVRQAREQVNEKLRSVMGEYTRLEQTVLPKVLKNLKNPLQAEGLAMTVVNGNVDELYLSKFNELLSELDELIKDLKKLLNISQESRQLTDAPESRMLPTAEHVQPSEAREIMGEKYFHDEQSIANTFGMSVEQIPEAPPIPFSKQELKKAKEDGCMLIYRVSITKDSQLLTMQNMHEMSKGKVGKLLYSGEDRDGWYNKPNKEEYFYTSETCRDGWALVQAKPLENSTNHDYFKQIEMLFDEVHQIYNAHEIPQVFHEARAEWNLKRDKIESRIKELRDGSLNEEQKIQLARDLSRLKINQLMRRNSTEAIFDMAVHYANSDERILEGAIYDWTITVSSDGLLVNPGRFDSHGARVDSSWPYYRRDILGVVVSRSVGNLSLAA